MALLLWTAGIAAIAYGAGPIAAIGVVLVAWANNMELIKCRYR